MSKEYQALMTLRRPSAPAKGDVWWCKRLGIVKVFTGHKRGTKRGPIPTNFHLYHWGKPSLYSHPFDWRDNDNNASVFDPDNSRGHGEIWKYLGNIFDMLPYATLTSCAALPEGEQGNG